MTASLSDVNAQNVEYNPLLVKWDTPYQTPPFDKIKPVHYLPAFISAISEAKMEVDAIALSKEEPNFENTILALERSGMTLSRISGIFFNILEADANKELQDIAKEVIPLLTNYQNYITLNELLFQRIKQVYDNRHLLQLNTEDAMLLHNTYLNFSRSGANLSPDDKKKYEQLTLELSKLSLEFKDNVLAATNQYYLHITNKADLKGIPATDIEIAAVKAKEKGLKGWVFDLSAPSYMGFMKYADNRELRKQMYLAYNSRAFHNKDYDNTNVVVNIVNQRLALANLLGYKTYADYVLEVRMAEYKDTVFNFLHRLIDISKVAALRELEELQEFASANEPLQRWDWSYYSNKLKMKKFNLDEQKVKAYFELQQVKAGVFELTKKLYGLTYQLADDIPVYHKDVEVYRVFDENKNTIAILYLDFYTRSTKRNGAWMTSFRKQSINEKGENIIPLVSLVLNYSAPTNNNPTLLTYDEFRTFLHEFGHALHGMLSTIRYQSLSGTSVPRDFVELPSQIMENWAKEKEFLDLFAKHYKTQQVIPNEMIEQLNEANNFHAGYAFLRQLNFGILDMTWHSIEQPINEKMEKVEINATQNTEILPFVEGCNISTAFSHIFAGGYAAGYYGYKWAEVLDADAFELFKNNGIFDKKTAASFREHILSKGGSDKPMNLYIQFRGRQPKEDALIQRSGLIPKK
ncbi:MAG TPA: M3 family metallopeptidase [Bacteroidales bacterium]|nr:M3 family metallopeptidase [Bacteroidales bacterium]HOR82568.1 M3 family metallopeptidase [Bacteroidales bacterium]